MSWVSLWSAYQTVFYGIFISYGISNVTVISLQVLYVSLAINTQFHILCGVFSPIVPTEPSNNVLLGNYSIVCL